MSITQERYIKNPDELCDVLGHELLNREVISSSVYHKVWVQWVLKNKKKQQYGFVITLFPSDGSLYHQKFLDRAVVNFEPKKDDNGNVSEYVLSNYEKVFDQIKQLFQ